MYSLKLYTYLAPSKVCDGVGVFSLVSIPADTLIFQPEKMKKGMWWEVPEEIHDYLKSLTYYDEEGFWIDCDLDKLGPQYYINHSLSPNVYYNKDNGCLYSTRDIQPHEELLDYYFPEERQWRI